jgi:hypothetical protein
MAKRNYEAKKRVLSPVCPAVHLNATYLQKGDDEPCIAAVNWDGADGGSGGAGLLLHPCGSFLHIHIHQHTTNC